MPTKMSTLVVVRDKRKEIADNAAKEFANLQQQIRTAESHIETMRSYMDDVKKKNSERNQLNVFGDQIKAQNDFLERIRLGIENQKSRVTLLLRQLDFHKQKWNDALVSLKQIENLIKRQQDLERHLDSRREQKQFDEISGRISSYSSSN